MQSRRAFTLVELLIAVTIIGIVTAAVFPSIGSNDDLKLAGAARTLMADIAYARMQAIHSQQKQFVQFTAQQYALFHNAGSTVLLPTVDPVNGGNFVRTFGQDALSSVSLTSANIGNQTAIGFDGLGSPASYNVSSQQFTPISATATVRLQSGTQFMTISIEPYTGEMSVNDG